MLKNKIKSIAITLTVALAISIGVSVPAFAVEVRNNTEVAKTTTVTTTTLDLSTIGTTPYSDNMIRESKGIKKTALVWALKYGGRAAAAVFDLIGDKAVATYLTENSYAIGAFLESISGAIEGKLLSFMTGELGIPLYAARIITWAIMQVVG
ncbi:hypothetical protein [Clostridium sp. HBUAS56017]|uniref:hypothetical protein n=1 Tax=Clostridium sp. HBUAS56017 TaxID=2571128 RepID=UPI001178A793|nr:hypothetical protein [Clostridium sp. HBUAS56017]